MHEGSFWDAVAVLLVGVGGFCIGAVGMLVKSASRLTRIETQQEALKQMVQAHMSGDMAEHKETRRVIAENDQQRQRDLKELRDRIDRLMDRKGT